MTPRERLRAQDWGTLRVKLKMWTYQAIRRRSTERAEDLAGDAIALAFDEKTPAWDPEKETILRYLTGLVRGILSNERRKKGWSQETLTAPEDLGDFAEDDARSPEAIATRRIDVQRFFDALAKRVADDAEASAVARCFERDENSTTEQIAATRLDKTVVVLARRRVYTAAEAIERSNAQKELH